MKRYATGPLSGLIPDSSNDIANQLAEKIKEKRLTEGPKEVLPIEVDLEKLQSTALEILRREITNLLAESTTEKLSAPSARDLVNYIELLSKLEKSQQEVLKNLSDEELEKKKSEVKQ